MINLTLFAAHLVQLQSNWDNDNVEELKKVAPSNLQHKILLFLDFAKNHEENEVPDPYYGGVNGFRFVLDLVEDASDGLLAQLK